MNLNGKKVLLGVSGSIAAYKACELLRLLQKEGAEVRVAMSGAATKFVAPLSFASLSKCPVYTPEGMPEARPFQHIDFPRWADLYLVAPATANVIGKFANGIADDPVSLCYMSSNCPKWIAPAMNSAMYLSHAVQRNLETLRSFSDTVILESPAGILACGEKGPGRFMEPFEIVQRLKAEGSEQKKMSKLSVLITAGRTEEAIDPVRYISNRSSGKTAVALAQAFLSEGFSVQFVHGPMDVLPPAGAEEISVQSSQEMYDAVMQRQAGADVIVHCAAVADYRPKEISPVKIKDSRSQLLLELSPNPNILRETSKKRLPGQIIVGFGLETDDIQKHGLEKFEKSGADLLVLNAPVAEGSGFGKDSVRFAILEKGKPCPELSLRPKSDLAKEVVSRVVKLREDFRER